MNVTTKAITMMIVGLAAMTGCSTAGLHGGNASDASHTSSHGSGSSAHQGQSTSNGDGQASHGSSHDQQAETSPLTSASEGQFPTVGFEERAEVMIPFSVTEVCPLFEPAGRFLLYDWWEPTILREAEGASLAGLIMITEVSGVEVLLTVTQHAPDAGQLQYIVLWGDFELQRIDITCQEGDTADSTIVVWNERNAGIHENGVSMVTTFVQGGNIQANLERYGQNVTQYLQEQ
ncbi:MAG: hypothetical protein AAF614_42355 [Chloroflexota bacterium]